MRNKVGANEPCSCGSGQKFKRCCRNKNNAILLPIEVNHKIIWQTQADKILYGVDKCHEIKKIFFILIDTINELKWRGACHFASALLCILFREIGLNAKICTGIVASANGFFSHSWVEVDGQVYDATIWFQNQSGFNHAPIIANKNLDTGEEILMLYGVDWMPLDPGTKNLFQKSFNWIINGMVETENAPIGMTVEKLLKKIVYQLKSLHGSYLDISELHEKHKEVKFTYADKHPADSLLPGYSLSLVGILIEGLWENDVIDSKGNNVSLFFSDDGFCKFEKGTEKESLYWHFMNNTIILSANDKFSETDIFAKLYDLESNTKTSMLCLKSDTMGLLYKSIEIA